MTVAPAKPDVPLVPVFVHGETAAKAVLLEPAKPIAPRPPLTEKPAEPIEDKDLIVIPIVGKPGARLFTEVTITQSADVCPRCDSPLLASPLGTGQDIHCTNCGHHFPAPTASEIIGVSLVGDDSQALFAKAHETKAQEDAGHRPYGAPARSLDELNAENAELRAQLHDKPKDADVNESAAERENIALRKRAGVQGEGATAEVRPAKQVALTNAWKRVASFDAEPGTHTEIWASVKSLPVSEVSVRLANPGNVDRFTSVAVQVSVLDRAAETLYAQEQA